jgi:hemerythrin-like domain-containing protein
MPRSKAKPVNAIQLLEEDHAYVKKAFKTFEKMDKADLAEVQKLVKLVCKELKAHADIEERLFYPAVRKAIKDKDLMNEALVEHASAKTLIRQLERMKPRDPMYAATFTVLGEYVQHHVKEEEGEMFPKVRRARVNLQALAKKLLARRIRLQKP